MSTRIDGAADSRLDVTWRFDLDYVTLARYAREIVEREFEHVACTNWATERQTLEGIFEHTIATLRDRTERAAVLDLSQVVGEECLAHLSLQHGHAELRVAARSVDTLASAKAWIRERYPVTVPHENRDVAVTFWSMSDHGPRCRTRRIAVPSWPEIGINYPSAVREQLEPLMDASFRPEQGGQLVLWHGEPGTGKTFALRGLAWEWRGWCSAHYVTDPETFFGSNAGYMLDVLLNEDDEERWRLLVLEDTGELLAADAKQRTGQGLSRLLNVVDGLIGQGLRVIVLVTTNEPLGSLHPAVARPGRCAAQIEFVPFSAEEAGEWLERHGEAGGDRAATLATLFARSAGLAVRERKNPLGFA